MGTVGPLRDPGSCLWRVQAGASSSKHHGGPQLGQVGVCAAAKATRDWIADRLQPHQVVLRVLYPELYYLRLVFELLNPAALRPSLLAWLFPSLPPCLPGCPPPL